jgi:hypothetical protein
MLQLQEDRLNLLGCFMVEIPGWLIRKEHRGPSNQGPSYRHPLLFAPGEFPRSMRQPFCHPDLYQQSLRPLARILFRYPGDKEGHRYVLPGRELGEKLVELEDKADMFTPKLCQLIVMQR